MVKEIKEILLEGSFGKIKCLFEKQHSSGQIYSYICESDFLLENCMEINNFSGQQLIDYVNTLNLNWIVIETISPS